MSHNILELYSGIGGMHCAWTRSGVLGLIVAAVDINTVANDVYRHNFPEINLMNRNIQSLSASEINKLKVDTILMSPPCQPFTRNGKYLDEEDPRTNSFLSLLSKLDSLQVNYILVENVKGFETSSVHKIFLDTLNTCNFDYQEFLLCPSKVGIPNSRLRYYCIARRKNTDWLFQRSNEIMDTLPESYGEPYEIHNVIEDCVDDQYLVPRKLLKRANIFDICYKHSRRSCCFTKAYAHYSEGTGSIYTDSSPEDVEKCYKSANNYEIGSEGFINELLPLHLRFFTPKEVLSLMEFPKSYTFPKDTTRKQCYRLLGNSINVKVVSELIKILYS